MKGRILVVDDEELFREDLAELLRAERHLCDTAGGGEEALQIAEAMPPDLVLCDLAMPGMSGVEVARRLTGRDPELPVILMTAYGTMETAIQAFRSGVTDYLLKPLSTEDLLLRVDRALAHRKVLAELRLLRREVADLRPAWGLIGESPAIRAIRKLIAKVAPSMSPVLITGESGTGKEVVARAIHEARGDGPFLAVNCAALPRDLLESELFGHVRGAFTGATKDRRGFFAMAGGGTLLLDEIAELPIDLQPKLLRVLESGQATPLGSSRPIATNARIVASTNRDLRKAIETGRFRKDLFYRLSVIEIDLPPLRSRREDIPLLAEHLLTQLNRRLGKNIERIQDAAMRLLLKAAWPGNVRELENALERAVLLCEQESITQGDLPAEISGADETQGGVVDLREATRAFERMHIERILAATGGNKEEAAKRLGINASTLHRRLRED